MAARSVIALVTTGATVATCVGLPLLAEFVVTTAVKLPAAVGLVVRFTVKVVAVALLTVPIAPLLKVTRLLLAVESKPIPLIVNVEESAFSLSDELVTTTGTTLAIWTGVAPLLIPLEVTTAVKLPPVCGLVVKLTVSEVAEAEATTPAAPLLKTIVLRVAVGSKPRPLITTEVASAARSAVEMVITGVTVAT